MTRIVFIGAGSVVFTRQLLADLFRFDGLELEIVLHDISSERLGVAHATALQLAARFDRSPLVRSTTDRRAALDGADFVVNAILVGGAAPGRIDLEVPAEAGLLQTVADTTGVGGVFRALRTFPVLSGIAADMASVCPDAVLLNYTNPMAMTVWWLSVVAPWLRSYGLCHSVYWTAHDLCELIGVPLKGTTFRAAGVNHQAWLTEWSRDGEDLYPRLRERIAEDPGLSTRVRMEIFRRVGYYPTETSKHSSEYLSWFLRSPEQIERFGIRPLDHIRTDEDNLRAYAETKDALAAGRELELEDHDATEYAPQIIHSMVTGTRRDIHVNVPNSGLIDNLPAGAVVEVPAVVSGDGIAPTAVGAIPTMGAALNRTYLSGAELTIEAALSGDAELVRRAVLVDGNASSSLTPDEIWALCDRLTEAHRRYLPTSLGGDVELPDVPRPRWRRTIAATIGATVLLTATACSGPGGSTKLDADADVTIEVWSGQTGPAQKILEDLADEFEGDHPNVTVDLSPGAPNADVLLQKLLAGFAGNRYPDVSYSYGRWASQLEASGRSLDVSDAIADPDIDWEDFSEASRETVQPTGDAVIGFPAVVDNIGLFYNKTLFDRAGVAYPTDDWSWDDFRTAAAALTDPDDQVYGYGTTVAGTGSAAFQFWPRLWQNGGEILTDDGSEAAFDSQAGVDALEHLRAMAVDDESVYLDQTGDRYLPLFISNRVAMVTSGPWNLSDLKAGGTDYGVVNLPGTDGDHQTVAGPDFWALLDHQDANRAYWATEFTAWLTQAEQDERFNVGVGNLPLRASELGSAAVQEQSAAYPGYDKFVANTDNVKHAMPTVAGYEALSVEVGKAISSVLQGQGDPESALKSAAEAADAALDE